MKVPKYIRVETSFFEHLLNCLANQKFTPYPATGEVESMNQAAIDNAWREGMDLLYSKTNRPCPSSCAMYSRCKKVQKSS